MSGFEIAGLAVLGFVASIFGTMVGIGGGVLFVPVFLLIFHFEPQQAIGTSLVIVFINAFSGMLAYLKQKRVDTRSGWKFALATVPGAGLGAWLSGYFTSNTLELIFGVVLMALALFIFLRKEPKLKEQRSSVVSRTLVDSHGEVFKYSPRDGLGIALSFVVGVVSSLLGIGGGIIHVPALIFLLGFPVHVAVGTSLFVLVISTFFGSISHAILGNVLIVPAIIVGLLAILGAQIGARLSRRVRGLLIMRLLALALILVGIRLIIK